METDRLVLRPWNKDDLLPFSLMNSDKEVMKYMPKCLSYDETVQFYDRISCEHETFGYGLYALELKSTGSFIGYTGFHNFDFDTEFSPGVEIGWRLAKEYWDRGYATEAARACIDYARQRKLFDKIYSFTVISNRRSERVMQKIGMEHHGFFAHPLLPEGHKLKNHTLYKLEL